MIIGLNYAPERTGIAPYTTAFARGMAKRGWTVRTITTHPHYPNWELPAGAAWKSVEVDGDVRIARLRHFVPRKPRGFARLLSELTFGIRAACSQWGDADAIVLVSPGLFASAIAMLRLRLPGQRRPVLTWVQDLYALGVTETGQGGARVARVMRAVESWVLRRSDAVTVIHDRFRDHAISELGSDESKVCVVRNWTHLREAPPIDRGDVRATFGWRDDETIVLHAGAMGLKQGLSNVAAAARLAERDGHPVRFVMIGGGSQRSELVEHSAGLGNMDILDALPDEDFQAALQAADVLLVNEKPGVAGMAVPSKLTSYFNAGRPVLAATDSGSVTESEVVRSGGGVVVAAGDPAALVSGVLELRSDPARGDALGAAGLEFRRTVLAEDVALDRYAQLLAGIHRRRQDVADRPGNPTTMGTI